MQKLLRNRGSAIISALFLMSIVALLSVTLITRQSVEIRRTQTIFQEQRLIAQLNWVELWAMAQLEKTFVQLTPEQDYITLDQQWAVPLTEFQQEGIYISGEISDLQAKFNINNLLAEITAETSAEAEAEQAEKENAENKSNPETTLKEQELPIAKETKKNPFDKETPYTTAWMVARLFTYVSDESIIQAQAITESILHWLKPELTEMDQVYFNLPTPYRAAHQAMQSISELLQVQFMNPTLFSALQPYTTAFISNEFASQMSTHQQETGSTSASSSAHELFPVNVNTASAPVLAAILNTDIPDAENVLKFRPYYNEKDLQSQISALNLKSEATSAQTMLSITSHYFLVKATARDQHRTLVQYTLLKRDHEGKLKILRKALGQL